LALATPAAGHAVLGVNELEFAAHVFAILHALVKTKSLIVTAKRSLEHRESTWDEIVTLEAAIKMLRRVDVALRTLPTDARHASLRMRTKIRTIGRWTMTRGAVRSDGKVADRFAV
jgi:hypothetical protein